MELNQLARTIFDDILAQGEEFILLVEVLEMLS